MSVLELVGGIALPTLSDVGEGAAVLEAAEAEASVELATEVELRELTGFEEEILAAGNRSEQKHKAKANLSPSQRITKVLARCTTRIGSLRFEQNEDPEKADDRLCKSFWHDALIGDRSLAVIRLRQWSIGDVYAYSDTCPFCKKLIPRLEVNLGGQESYPYFEYLADDPEFATVDRYNDPLEGEELKRVQERLLAARRRLILASEHQAEMPDGTPFTWRLMRGSDEDELQRIPREYADQWRTQLLKQQLVSFNGEKVRGATLAKLGWGERNFLSEFFDTRMGGLDTEIIATCPNSMECGKEFRRYIDLGRPDFFFPSAGRRTSR